MNPAVEIRLTRRRFSFTAKPTERGSLSAGSEASGIRRFPNRCLIIGANSLVERSAPEFGHLDGPR